MSEKIILNVSDELAGQITEEYETRRQKAIDSLSAHGWSTQAKKIENTDIAENTAEQVIFLLKQEVGQ